jgi:hypothetical protein
MSEYVSDLKRPIGIYILALLFILAPIGNIFVSFAGSGVEGWYRPEVFSELMQTIPVPDWIWLAGIFFAGIALFLRHKSAWMIAVVALLLILVMNTVRAFNVDESSLNPEFVRMQILISILVTFSVLIIAFYARYPYLDRRQQWMFPTAHRYQVATPVMVHIDGDVMGMTDSVSSDGVRIEMSKVVDAIKHAKDLEVSFTEFDNFRVKSDIIEFNGTVLRLQYKRFGWERRGRLEAWLKSKKA